MKFLCILIKIHLNYHFLHLETIHTLFSHNISGVRLVGGSHCSGRVEVLHRETWSTVCDADFDQQDAEVVCRELGCGLPVEVLGAAAFGRGEGQVWSEELQCRGNGSQIFFCPTSSSLKHNCSHDNDVGLVCAGSVRLVNGDSRCTGRVEVLHRGQWGTVCDDGWDMRDAAVVCRELGCGEAVNALSDAHFGPGSGQIWMVDVDCSGSESTVKNCHSALWGKQACNHSNDAGVFCSVRLVGGSRCSGRVEVLHGETWSTVCDADFDQQDAEVVCRELGCGLPVEVLGAATFGRGEGQVWSEELQCRGNESQIHFCPTSSSLKHNCSHDRDVGPVTEELSFFSISFLSHILSLCYTDSVRLVDGGSRCAGRVEVLHRGQWGTVCGDYWDMRDAAVVCRELHCGEAVDALSDGHFGSGSGQIWMNNVACSGSESTLKSCKSPGWGKHNCDHSKDAGVICSEVRLVGGSRCSGRVEVLHGGTWSTVCDADFDQQDAEVVCQELGCGLPVEVLGSAAFGRGEGQVWSEELQCRGNESQIYFCPTSSLKHNCSHENDVGVVCAGSVRLVDGGSRCAGRVEVLHRGQWGTVCGYIWNMRDVSVVCRELSCGEPLSLDAAVGGSGPIWMSHVDCSGSESTLKHCGSLGWGKHICIHLFDVEIHCSGHRRSKLTGGPHRCSGRVEVLHEETWSTVCDADFDQQDAEVVCRELGCGLPVEVLGAAAFGRGEGQVWSEELQCRGIESEISLCPTSSSLRLNCTHGSDVGLICSGHTQARLVNGSDSCSGRVELQYLSEWGTVCDVSWDMRAASVLCGQLKCGSAVAVLGSDWFGEGSGQIWADVFDCQGNETHLSKCPISSWSLNCSSREQLSVTCSGMYFGIILKHINKTSSIRLVGSVGDCAGRLEVFHSGSWGTVCDDLWDIEDAQVVCRQLQCGVALSAPVPAQFGPGTGPIWLNEVECEGNETSLFNCRFQMCGEDECGHMEDVGVVCSEFKEIRLTEGCQGNLEVFYNETWGNVCTNNMDEEVANLVCQELNCGRSGSLSQTKARVESAPNWLDDLKCRKHDSNLWQCPSSAWGQNSCDNLNEVAHITCSGRQFLSLNFKYTLSSSCVDENALFVRLVDGGSRCAGRVEVLHRGQWGTVCDDGWDMRDAAVVCRELGCGEAGDALSDAHFGPGSGQIWMVDVDCSGSESTLKKCHSALWGKQACNHSNDAGVFCSGKKNYHHFHTHQCSNEELSFIFCLVFSLSLCVIQTWRFFIEDSGEQYGESGIICDASLFSVRDSYHQGLHFPESTHSHLNSNHHHLFSSVYIPVCLILTFVKYSHFSVSAYQALYFSDCCSVF
uniref:SRCR domain-containing protein n=1 Tax=Pygocentrus nattereri TaxID=42514 RepID=A0A3B4EAH2_PYGNA